MALRKFLFRKSNRGGRIFIRNRVVERFLEDGMERLGKWLVKTYGKTHMLPKGCILLVNFKVTENNKHANETQGYIWKTKRKLTETE